MGRPAAGDLGPGTLGTGAPLGRTVRGRQRDPEMARAFTYGGDLVGAQHWALQHGWTVSDGVLPRTPPCRRLVASAPVRPNKEHRPASVLRGRAGPLELVAFDVVYPTGRSFVAQYAVTAAPVLGTVPRFRLAPARFWKHGTGGLVPIPSGDDAFDGRWQLLAAEDGAQVRAWPAIRRSRACCWAATTATSSGRPPAMSRRSGRTATGRS